MFSGCFQAVFSGNCQVFFSLSFFEGMPFGLFQLAVCTMNAVTVDAPPTSTNTEHTGLQDTGLKSSSKERFQKSLSLHFQHFKRKQVRENTAYVDGHCRQSPDSQCSSTTILRNVIAEQTLDDDRLVADSDPEPPSTINLQKVAFLSVFPDI